MTLIESETVELNSSVVADICKEAIAFANTRSPIPFPMSANPMKKFWI